MAVYPSFKVAEAVDEAFERLQFNPASLVAEHLVSARRSIRLMLDTWNSDSVNFWKVVNVEHTVTLDEESFTPAAGTLDILNAALNRDDLLTPMVMLAREDWFNIPDRAVIGGSMPTRYWVERTSVPPTVHYYPKAGNSTDIIVYDAWVQYDDASQLSGGLGVPPRWNEAFTAGLTAFLAKKYKPERAAELMREYGGPAFCSPPNTIKSAYEIARMGDRERASTIMVAVKSRRPRR